MGVNYIIFELVEHLTDGSMAFYINDNHILYNHLYVDMMTMLEHSYFKVLTM